MQGPSGGARGPRDDSELSLIDQVCGRFEAAWGLGREPAIDPYLDQVPAGLRDRLRRELEAIAAERRRGRGSEPGLQEFIDRLVGSGLLKREEIEAVRRSIPSGRRPQEAKDLARELVRAGKLTKYQAGAAYQGKTKGLVLGDYVVLDRIGAGGMGQVFRARHRRMDRVVALKVLGARTLRSPQAVERFQREVRAAAKLNHPNIVTAHDAGEAQGVHFLVMEHVEGKDLGAVVAERGPLPVEEAVGYVIQAARGLEYAHGQGVTHRDIKPGNLLLDRDGTVKILDMGLARLEGSRGPTTATASEPLTESGQVMGTCDYMAPEQARDTHRADHRADIYALGCTLYRLLTGRRPFEGETAAEILLAHQQSAVPSLRALRPEVPAALEAAFQKMLAKDPADRQQSMGDVILELESALAPATVARQPVGTPPHAPGPVVPPPAGVGEEKSASTDSALAAFLQSVSREREGVRARRRAGREETVVSSQLQATEVRAPSAAAAGSAPASASSIWQRVARRPWLWAVPAGVAAALGVLLVLRLAGSGKPAGVASHQEPAAAGESSGARPATTAGEPTRGQSAPTRRSNLATLRIVWPQAERSDARVEVDGKAIGFAEMVDSEGPNRLRLELPPGQHHLWIVRRGFVPFDQNVALSAGQELVVTPQWVPAPESPPDVPPVDPTAQTPPEQQPAQPAQAAVDAAAGQATAASPGEQAMRAPAGEVEEPAGVAARDPARAARRKLLQEYRQAEVAYRQAIGPVAEHLQAWQFAEAASALERARVGDPQTTARIAAWQKAIAQLARRLPEVIAAINQSGGKLTKRDFHLRGVGGTVTQAGPEGITAKTIAGKTEQYPWQEMGPEAWRVLLPLVDTAAADDWLAAGVHAIACGDRQAGRRYLDQAADQGADLAPVLAALAAESFAEADRQLQAAVAALEKLDLKAARLALRTGEKLLDELATGEASAAWASEQKQLIDALQAELAATRHELEAEELYAQAVDLYQKAQTEHENSVLFDVKLLLEEMTKDYAGCRPLVDISRSPSIKELTEATKNLGRVITVRQDGQGDFTTIQAAIDAAPPKSLIEIQDNGPYNEQVTIPKEKQGLTLGGAEGCWPIVTSSGPKRDFATLVHVAGQRITLRRLILLHTTPTSGGPHCLAVVTGGDDFRLRSSMVVMPQGDAGFYVGRGRGAELADSVLIARSDLWRHVVFRNCLLFGPVFSIDLGSELWNCTTPFSVTIRANSVVVDSVVRELHIRQSRVENCNVFRAAPPASARNCFSADPQFRDPANLDFRLLPTSPCIGRASDGGDIGCRYTPEMIEMCKIALELRARGLIKF